jgi:hypothetical protein
MNDIASILLIGDDNYIHNTRLIVIKRYDYMYITLSLNKILDFLDCKYMAMLSLPP